MWESILFGELIAKIERLLQKVLIIYSFKSRKFDSAIISQEVTEKESFCKLTVNYRKLKSI